MNFKGTDPKDFQSLVIITPFFTPDLTFSKERAAVGALSRGRPSEKII